MPGEETCTTGTTLGADELCNPLNTAAVCDGDAGFVCGTSVDGIDRCLEPAAQTCALATEAQMGGNVGDLAVAFDGFAGSCSPPFGAPEQAFSYTVSAQRANVRAVVNGVFGGANDNFTIYARTGNCE